MNFTVTGPREGITPEQIETARRLLGTLWTVKAVMHNGCCVGADAALFAIARDLGIKTIGHPGKPLGDTLRAALDCDEMREVMPPLKRNEAMVSESIWLLATPGETLDGGTLRTVELARKAGIAVTLIWPDGRAEVERAGREREQQLDLQLVAAAEETRRAPRKRN